MTRNMRIPRDVERAIVVFSSEQPILGRVRVAAKLNRRGIKARPSTVRTIWRRYGLENAQKRVKAFAPIHDSQELLICRAAPGSISLHDYMSEAFVFSVAALTMLAPEIAGPSGQPSDHTFHFREQTAPPTGEDHAAFSGHDARLEIAHVDQTLMPPADFLI